MKQLLHTFFIALALLVQAMAASDSSAQSNSANSTQAQSLGRRVSRVFFQDDQARTLKWADLYTGAELKLGPVSEIKGFPKLDPETQSLVQMESSEGFLLIGVRDEEDGQFQSGWVLVDSGVKKEEHGDHFHWRYPTEPKVRAQVLDKAQGNPAHVYCYDGVFFVANDKLGGCTRLDPRTIVDTDNATTLAQRAAFHVGGGGHITLAAVQNKFLFSTWIDRQGDHAGQVDVCTIQPKGNKTVLGSVKLPSGGLHGATACLDRAFFAPADGVCWLQIPKTASWTVGDLKVEHLSLGKDGDKPARTGAFTTFDKYVCFTTGGGATAKLNWIDASASKPTVQSINIPMDEKNKPAGLELVRGKNRQVTAFLFHDHAADQDAPNKLTVVRMDSNTDGKWDDAAIAKELEVGKASVEGHGGHHSLSASADATLAALTNSGDSTVSLMKLDDLSIASTINVGGTPSKVVLIGGK